MQHKRMFSISSAGQLSLLVSPKVEKILSGTFQPFYDSLLSLKLYLAFDLHWGA